MRMILISLAIVAVVLGGLAAFTALSVRRIESAHPPAGRFVEAWCANWRKVDIDAVVSHFAENAECRP